MYCISSLIYLSIIILLILLNIIYIVVQKIRKKSEENKRKTYEEKIKEQLKRLKDSSLATKEHLLWIEKELGSTSNLLIFEETLEKLKEENKQLVADYCKSITVAIQSLAVSYRKKSSMQKAYFTHVLSLFPELLPEQDDAINYAMMHFVLDDSVYCRENAMKFFYHKNSAKLVVNSLKKISKRNLYYSPKQLTDDLLSFTGDGEELAENLLKEFSKFSSTFQLAIINYLRFSAQDKTEEIYKMYSENKYHKEVRLAIIRYFGTHKNKIVLNELIEIMKNKDRKKDEYRLIAACALASYDTKTVRNVLIEGLTDKNWYVRKNSAISLSKMALTVEEKEKILSLSDPYAKEMFAYIWQETGKATKPVHTKVGKE